MSNKKQKKIFLETEGDAWFMRNQKLLESRKLPDDDSLLPEIIEIFSNFSTRGIRVLEIGCGNGSRLAWLKKNLNADVYGVEPSIKAVDAALKMGVNAFHGSADSLPFGDNFFDLVIYGFCLYLTDREDLHRIAFEGDRVLRSPGYLMILDFFSHTHRSNTYHHALGVQTFKMDYSTLFTFHPAYNCVTQKLRAHSDLGYTDKQDDLIAISVLRKFIQ